MTINYKLKVLKISKIAVLIVFIPLILFYFGIIVPEYLACERIMFEGEKGVDIWGSEIECGGESQAFGEAFFQMFSLIICIFLAVLLIIFFLIFQTKKNITTKK